MGNDSSKHGRNLFEVDNARNLSMQELVDTFILTQSFWRLFTAKHQVILGARGHGKTALAKMVAHDHLALLAQTRDEPRVRNFIREQEFIGIYLPTRLEWVGGLKNKPWLDEREREELFQWRLNIACCIAFIPIACSCIATYISEKGAQAKAERKLAEQLSTDWLNDNTCVYADLQQLRQQLEDTDYHKQIQLLRKRANGRLPEAELPVGLAFDMELFGPLRQGIRRLSRLLGINPNCSWLLCLDEAEFLDVIDHRIINSHMRAYPEKLFIKMTTMPYCHHTLATNIGAALVPGQDFGYVNMAVDRVLTAKASGEIDTIGTRFGRTLFKNLIQASYRQVTEIQTRDEFSLTQLLGVSDLLDPKREAWDAHSENMLLLEKYASRKTMARARRLAGTSNFAEAISRKINGPLLLRKMVDEWKGNSALTAYSGARMAIRCADDNPRHLIKIFNQLLMRQSMEDKKAIRVGLHAEISPEDQTRAMRALSASTLNQYRSYPDVGPELHAFLCMLGTYMYSDLHLKALTTDQVTSVEIDSSISNEEWNLVRIAVGHGLLHPNVGLVNPDELPCREGTYHLAFALAPYFLLFPRRGKAVKLTTVRAFTCLSGKEKTTFLETGQVQTTLFEKGQ